MKPFLPAPVFFRMLLIGTMIATLRFTVGITSCVAATDQDGPACFVADRWFADEVWEKVGKRTCLKCHNASGDASESAFVLQDPDRDRTRRDAVLRKNRLAFEDQLEADVDGESRLLQKVVGGLDHGGGEVLQAGSTGYRVLQRFVRRLNGKPDPLPSEVDDDPVPFFDGLVMMPPRQLLRRVTLSLVGRLPSHEELSKVETEGLSALSPILDDVMREDAFYERLQEAFNDILLTRGYDGVAEGALSYEHFKSRLWYQELDPNRDRKSDEKLKYSHPEMIAYTKLVRDYREAMLREPLELIRYIVGNDRPFTEIVTADYTMVSPYTSRGYGVFEQVRGKFKDTDDPFEFVPTKIPALTSRNGKVQESKTGFYPHSGLLSSFQYLMRYPTTETNRNRLRVRMFFQHFLGVDLLELAPRTSDAAAITAEYDVPTMQASDCVVCHKIMDPVAGLFQDYYVVDAKGVYGPRKEGWYEDMFVPGWGQEALPPEERWRALQWLGQRTARDPRFATAMVEHVWYILSGRQPLSPPEDIDDPMYSAKHRAYRVQRNEIERIADRFIEADFNLKVAFKEWIHSDFYRADGLATEEDDPRRRVELDDVGLVRLLTPEQLERKLMAIFGKKWGRLTDREAQLNILYGGIDSQEVTERITDPSGAMGAIQRILANDLACRHVAADFSLPAEERRLFPGIEIDVVPGGSDEGDRRIHQAIVHLHALILGRNDAPDDPEVQRTFDLFAGIVSDAKSRPEIDPTESYFCQSQREVTPRDPDPHYTIRAWRAVVTYVLRQHEFLYE
ncbi:hypothetical protein [Stieleria magnilauensis]|uniref:DUF1592 domain-containing protein n=1 Tax=Stieleria magnilauensis TaxID=2527963 RepID=A0ABX5XUX7_9BACT|nr:hypothetical protein TBK1r_34150 [Planctomycetes bacterium TBK1r]